MLDFIKIIILFTVPVVFSSLEAGELAGTVLNASRDSMPAPGIDVELLAVIGQQAPFTLDTTTTDSRGRFKLQLNQPASGGTVYASAQNQGVRYYSDALSPDESSGLTLFVYDTTHSAASLHILMHHVVVQDLGKTVHIRETRVFENDSNLTVLDVRSDTPVGPALFQFSVPKELMLFQPGERLSDADVMYEKGRVYDKRILPPGKSQLTYTYELNWKGNRTPVLTDIHPDTRSFGVFLADTHLQAISEHLQDRGDFQIGSHIYRRYSGTRAGDKTLLQFAVKREGVSAQSPWPAIIISVFFCIGAYLIVLRVKRK
ncbi:MAG: hypothetical protein U5R06_13800 [candidate division KSB1 bacterium]|nr:hypothetical protein [candidate division KSB1 bacterium]